MINPQMIAQVQQMFQKGMTAKDIIIKLKNQGITPQVAEDVLCAAFPQVKQAKQAIANSGMSTKDYLAQLAKQNNIPMEQLKGMFGDFK